PLTATTSPGRAPERTTGSPPPRSPSAVTAIVRVGLADMSPPTTLAPTSAASAASPSASSSAQRTSRFMGAQSATSSAVGTALVVCSAAGSAIPARPTALLTAFALLPDRQRPDPASNVAYPAAEQSTFHVRVALCGSFTCKPRAGGSDRRRRSRVVVQAYILI